MGEIYTFTGKGSLERKALKLLEIMKRCSSADEIKFLFRILKVNLQKTYFLSILLFSILKREN